jgi:hypothetical protein
VKKNAPSSRGITDGTTGPVSQSSCRVTQEKFLEWSRPIHFTTHALVTANGCPVVMIFGKPLKHTNPGRAEPMTLFRTKIGKFNSFLGNESVLTTHSNSCSGFLRSCHALDLDSVMNMHIEGVVETKQDDSSWSPVLAHDKSMWMNE